MAASNPTLCKCTYRTKPDHSKFATFTRAGTAGTSSAIVGGINLGDRFAEWDDYAMRLSGACADELRCSLIADDDYEECLAQASFAFSSAAASNSVAAATAIAYVSPLVALATTLTAFSGLATCALVTPLGVAVPQPDLATWRLWSAVATSVFGIGTAMLGTAFATAADGGPFDLPYELQLFARSLMWDRSALGDVLAPLRRRFNGRYGIIACADDADGAAVAVEEPSPSSSSAHARAEGGARDLRLLPLPTLPSAAVESVRLVCNRRAQRRYEIEPTYRALFADGRITHYRIAMAYLGHRWGVELLEYALRRNARVELLLPERPNVYAHENLRAAQTLIDARWPTLELYLHPEMVHAKATIGLGEDGPLAFVGSANLVRGSLNLPVHCGLLPYDELNVLTSQRAVCAELEAEMDRLFARARRVAPDEQLLAASDWYNERKANSEELFQ